MRAVGLVTGLIGIANAACPYMTGETAGLDRRGEKDAASGTEEFLSEFYLKDDENVFLTSDVGGPIEDQNSLKAGERGPTLLEDFIFRQKIQRFDHERVCFSRDFHFNERKECALMTLHRFRSAQSTLEGLVPMEFSPLTAIGQTSLQLLSCLRKARRRPCLCVSLLLPEAEAVPTPLAMYTALRPVSTLMKAISVRRSIHWMAIDARD